MVRRMEMPALISRSAVLALGAAVLVSGLLGAGFAAWLDKGPRLFLALAETGLGWCF